MEYFKIEILLMLIGGFITIFFSVLQRKVHEKLDDKTSYVTEVVNDTSITQSTHKKTYTLTITGTNNDVKVVQGENAQSKINITGVNNDKVVRIPKNSRIKLNINGVNNDVVFDRVFISNIVQENITGINNDVEYK